MHGNGAKIGLIMDIITELKSTPPPSLLFHYTKPSSARAIIKGRRLWATDIEYLNDRTEFTLALELLEKERDQFSDLIRKVPHGGEFLMHLYSILKHGTEQPEESVYVFSFSALKDDRVAWDIYGNHGEGYCLGFDYESLKEPLREQSFSLVPCEYDSGKHTEIIHQFQKNAVDIFHNTLSAFRRAGRPPLQAVNAAAMKSRLEFLEIAPMIKNSSWNADNEWRLVSKPLAGRDLWGRKYASSRESGIIDDKIIPYFEFNLNTQEQQFHFASCLVGGALSFDHEMMNFESRFVPQENIRNGFIAKSKVPYRFEMPERSAFHLEDIIVRKGQKTPCSPKHIRINRDQGEPQELDISVSLKIGDLVCWDDATTVVDGIATDGDGLRHYHLKTDSSIRINYRKHDLEDIE